MAYIMNASTNRSGKTTGRVDFTDLRRSTQKNAEAIVHERYPDAIVERDTYYGGWKFTQEPDNN